MATVIASDGMPMSPTTQTKGFTVGFGGISVMLSDVYSDAPEPEMAAVKIQ
jgi:hypothetical protein